MSIRRHLFLLITGLVLIIAIAQVALLFHFKNNVDDEIERRGKAFADRILKYTIDSIENEELATEFTPESEAKLRTKLDILTYIPEHDDPLFINLLRINVSKKQHPKFNIKLELPANILNTPEKFKVAIAKVPEPVKATVVSLAQELKTQKMHSIELTENGYRIKLNIKQPQPNRLIKRHLARQIENMKNIGIDNDNIKIETTLEDGTKKVWHAKTIRKHDPNEGVNRRKSQISQLFNYVTLVIIFTTLVSIILVFWLSKRFSKPMQELVNGFKQLENGKFGVQVTPQGVTEVSQTIERFNTMSNQLVKLADAESKLQQQQHLTEISDVSKGIAHALRNPMHTIGLAIEQLQKTELTEQQKHKLFNQIQSKIIQLDKNIKALLAVTSNGLQRDQTLSLSALIQDVILELKQTHNNAKGKLDVHLELDRSIKIVGAESEFRSIIHTLIFNAYEASLETTNDPGKQDQDKMITLKIKTYTKNELAVISTIDYGSGLTKDIESKLFTAHCSTKAEGAGMGLYISKRLVELYYDGTLTVENNLTENSISGVTATCTLPSLTL